MSLKQKWKERSATSLASTWMREVWATCNCPYNDVCKQMVAVLLQIVNEGLNRVIESPGELPSPKESAKIIRKSLKSLSKKELTELVIKFAPVEYLEEIRNRNDPEQE